MKLFGFPVIVSDALPKGTIILCSPLDKYTYPADDYKDGDRVIVTVNGVKIQGVVLKIEDKEL